MTVDGSVCYIYSLMCCIHQLVPLLDRSRSFCKTNKKKTFGDSQFDEITIPCYQMAITIYFLTTNFNGFATFFGVSTVSFQDRFYPEKEKMLAEGFCDEVVHAKGKSYYLVLLFRF